MPRKPKDWIETVEPFPPLRVDEWYRVRITAITRRRPPPGFDLTLEHLGQAQAGRIHCGVLPGPIRPAGITAAFFAACGQGVAPGEQVRPAAAAGQIVMARFITATDGSEQARDFQAANQEASHD